MTPRQSPDDDLTRWLSDGPTQAPAPLLAAVRASLSETRQRRRMPWRLGRRRTFVAFAQAVAGVALLAAVGLGVLYLAGGPRSGGVGGPSVVPGATESTLPAAGQATPTTPTTPPTPALTPGPASSPATPTTAPCGPANTVARITSWQGAAGQRIASVELTNISAAPCTLRAQARPQLVDATGRVLIDSPAAAASGVITLAPGGRLTSLVEDGNYCGAAPVAPVRIGLTLSAGERVIASPPSPADATVPPCNGAGVGSYIRMHPWGG